MNSPCEKTQTKMEPILQKEFSPLYLKIEDNSERHASHGAKDFGGGHFRVLIVSKKFSEKSLIEQHRLVNQALAGLFGREIHALALKTLSPEEWEKDKNIRW